MAIWREATALIDAGDDFRIRAWAHSSAARAATATHQLKLAEREYAEAARLFALAPRTKAIQNDILWNEIRTARVEADLGQFESGIARLTRIQEQVRSRSDKVPEEMFYATLGELHLRSHHVAQAEQAFGPALESAERRLLSLNSEAERINWSKEAAPVYLGMAQAKLEQGQIAESLAYFEWYLGAGSRAGEKGRSKVPPLAAADPSFLISRLPLLSTTTVLAYAALPGGLAVWVYDDRGTNAQWIPQSNQDLQELAARFYALASDPRSEATALQRDTRSLYTSLIAPIESRLEPGRTLVIEAEGWLAQVPFEALLDPDGHYLIERAPMVHSLGQSTDASLHKSLPISKQMPALVVGSTASSQSNALVPLPDVLAETDAVAADFDFPNVLQGSQATLSAVRRELPAAAVFHFTGHALARNTGSGLVLLGEDSDRRAPVLLGADKLRRLDLRNLQLAVLSTCNPESGKDGARGFNSIAEALQRNGVPNIVASRWAVDSAQTRQFIQTFYRHALSGHPVSEAVRQASRNMLADPRTSHPYYWSAFSAYGRP
jgi:CHAT domain-containing protein